MRSARCVKLACTLQEIQQVILRDISIMPQPCNIHCRSSGLAPPPSPYPQHVDPSPTDSNGTESTDIDEDSQEANSGDATGSPLTSGLTSPITSPNGQDTVCWYLLGASMWLIRRQLTMVTTGLPVRSRSNSDDAPQSVIHAPPGFLDYVSSSYAPDWP